MPGYASDSRHGAELVDDIAGDEVNVIVSEGNASIANPFPPKLVELSIFYPCDTLKREGASSRWISTVIAFFHN